MPSKGSIHPYKNGFRGVVYFQDLTGRTKRKEFVRQSEAAVRSALREWKKDFRPLPSGANLTVLKMCEAAIELCNDRGRSHDTIRGYRYYLNNYIKPTIGHMLVVNLKADHIENLIKKILEQGDGIQNRTLARQVRNFLRMAINRVALKKQIVLLNVAALAETPTIKRVRPDHRLTPEQFSIILSMVNDKTAYAYFLFLAETGFRPTEARKLMRKELFQEEDGLWARLENSKTPEGKKPVPISKVAADAIQAILTDSIFVFASKQQGTLTTRKTLAEHWTKALAKAQAVNPLIPYVTPYALRKLFGSVMARTEQEAVLKRLMRHTNIATTHKYYVEAFNPDLRRAVEKQGEHSPPHSPHQAGNKTGSNDK